MRVMDGDLIIPTCLQTPTLILPAGRFIQMYYDPDAQGQYASNFPTGGQGFLQPQGDIKTSIVPKNFRVLPADVREVIDQHFHREELEERADQEEEEYMSTDTEAANTVRRLQLHCPAAMVSLQEAVHEALVPATAAQHRMRSTTTIPMTRSLTWMKNSQSWQNGLCSGRPPTGALPLLHHGGHPASVKQNGHATTSCPTCGTS